MICLWRGLEELGTGGKLLLGLHDKEAVKRKVFTLNFAVTNLLFYSA